MESRACQDSAFDHWFSITSVILCLHPSSDSRFSFGSPGLELQEHKKEVKWDPQGIPGHR